MQQPQTRPAYVVPLSLSNHPQRLNCPFCGADVMTSVRHKPGLITHLVCLCMALFGCALCCCLPYCVDSCKNTEHECPSCRRFIGEGKIL